MKTAKITLDEIKCSDGWFDLGGDLGFSHEKIRTIFEYGEYGSIQIIVDENLNIVGGHIIPFDPESLKKLNQVEVVDDTYLARKTDGRLLKKNEDGETWSFADDIGRSPKYSRSALPDSHFEVVTESDFPMLTERGVEYFAWLSWSSRPDGHGGAKGGTLQNFRNLPESEQYFYKYGKKTNH